MTTTGEVLKVLEQAQAAAYQQDWSLLNQYLQQLLQEQEIAAACRALDRDTYLQQLMALALESLEAGDFHLRWEVAKVFPSLGEIVINPLLEILKDETAEWELRWFAARILGEFNHPEIINVLVELLKTADRSSQSDLSSIAAEALTNLGPLAVSALTDLLADPDWRLLAVQSLARMRQPEVISALLSVVNDPQAVVRSTAIAALNSLPDPQILPVLVNALHDPAAEVRREAVIGLGLQAPLISEVDLVHWLGDRLNDSNLIVCQQAAITLGRLGTDAAATALFQALAGTVVPVVLQVEIVRALSWISTPTALTYLRQLLLSDLEVPLSVVQEIVAALGRVEQPNLMAQAVDILLELLSATSAASDPSIQQLIALGLGQLGDRRALNPLIQLLADSEPGVQLHAIAALKQLDSESARQQLENLSQEQGLSPNLQQGVAMALQEW